MQVGSGYRDKNHAIFLASDLAAAVHTLPSLSGNRARPNPTHSSQTQTQTQTPGLADSRTRSQSQSQSQTPRPRSNTAAMYVLHCIVCMYCIVLYVCMYVRAKICCASCLWGGWWSSPLPSAGGSAEVRALPPQAFQHIPAHLNDLVDLFPRHCEVRSTGLG